MLKKGLLELDSVICSATIMEEEKVCEGWQERHRLCQQSLLKNRRVM